MRLCGEVNLCVPKVPSETVHAYGADRALVVLCTFHFIMLPETLCLEYLIPPKEYPMNANTYGNVTCHINIMYHHEFNQITSLLYLVVP